jgi:lysophospholipase L1-like esterase
MRLLKAELAKIIAVNVLIFLALLLLAEGIGQGIALLRPSYEVLYLKPDRELGWREVPGLHWTWAGFYWYAADYSVKVQTNRAGFRDFEREYVKPAGVKRVAALGDSFIEAVQVPLEKTATQLLERRLNAPQAQAAGPQKWEVLNFGISSFGVGQFLLTWEQEARRYSPDYVVVFVAKFIMDRTVQKYEQGRFQGTSAKQLWIRPTFRVDGDTLIREPARDFEKFARLQDSVIQNEFGGQRSRRRVSLVTLLYARRLHDDFDQWRQRHAAQRPTALPHPDAHPEIDANMLATNLKVLEELQRQATAAHSVLVIVDASRYFGDDPSISTALQDLCAKGSSVYVPFYKDMQQASAKGIPLQWSHDGHLSEAGNALLADAIYRSLIQERRGDGH